MTIINVFGVLFCKAGIAGIFCMAKPIVSIQTLAPRSATCCSISPLQCTIPQQITSYRVYYTLDPSMPLNQWESDSVNAGSTTLTTISNLIPHEIYTFRVQAETLVGRGPISDPVRAKTQQGGELGDGGGCGGI